MLPVTAHVSSGGFDCFYCTDVTRLVATRVFRSIYGCWTSLYFPNSFLIRAKNDPFWYQEAKQIFFCCLYEKRIFCWRNNHRSPGSGKLFWIYLCYNLTKLKSTKMSNTVNLPYNGNRNNPFCNYRLTTRPNTSVRTRSPISGEMSLPNCWSVVRKRLSLLSCLAPQAGGSCWLASEEEEEDEGPLLKPLGGDGAPLSAVGEWLVPLVTENRKISINHDVRDRSLDVSQCAKNIKINTQATTGAPVKNDIRILRAAVSDNPSTGLSWRDEHLFWISHGSFEKEAMRSCFHTSDVLSPGEENMCGWAPPTPRWEPYVAEGCSSKSTSL